MTCHLFFAFARNSVDKSNVENNEVDQDIRLKNIDPKMIETIQSEIMESNCQTRKLFYTLICVNYKYIKIRLIFRLG